MSELFSARAQMGTSLVFHIVFSVLGVGLPLLLCIAEGLALRNKDSVLLALARRWSLAFAIVFAIGAVSGAIVEFEISLLWPTFTRFSGSIIGLPFAMEGFAFFLEAIFLGLYLYGWGRLTPRAHWLTSFPVWISGAFSAWFIVSANSWMNTPAGFQRSNGVVTGIDPFKAIGNPSTPFETTHMILASYVATGFGVAAVYAWALLRGHRTAYNRKGLVLGLAMGVIAAPLQVISGDFNARFLEHAQPAKYAAMEGQYQTAAGSPLIIGGIPDDQARIVHFALTIPHGESLLATFTPNAVTPGLDQVQQRDWPGVFVVHSAFDLMVGSGFFVVVVALTFWLLYYRQRRRVPEERRWLLWGICIAGPLAFLAVEAGWIVTEEGRQPWVVYGILRTANAVTPSAWMNVSFGIFSLVYLVLGGTLAYLLLQLGRREQTIQPWNERVATEQEG